MVLPVPGGPGEHQVVGALGHFQPALLTHQLHCHRALEPRDLILDLLQADELVELTLGLGQQHGLALLGSRVDEIAGLGLGGRVPGVDARVDAVRGGGHDPEAGIRQRLFDLSVFRVGGVQVLQHLAGGVLVAVGA